MYFVQILAFCLHVVFSLIGASAFREGGNLVGPAIGNVVVLILAIDLLLSSKLRNRPVAMLISVLYFVLSGIGVLIGRAQRDVLTASVIVAYSAYFSICFLTLVLLIREIYGTPSKGTT